ncbi:MAG: hypothetical protein ACFCU1_02540 [Sumerlaeia bacterium]
MTLKITERLTKRGEVENIFDREFWAKAGHDAKFIAAWQMVIESYLFWGKDAGELRLQQSVETLQRRRR